MVTGTQADKRSQNKLSVMKIESLCKTKHDNDAFDDDDSDDDDDVEEDPVLHVREVKKTSGTNRIRVSVKSLVLESG